MEIRKLTLKLIHRLEKKLSYLLYRLETVENKLDSEFKKKPLNNEKYFSLLKTCDTLEKRTAEVAMQITETYKQLHITK